MASLLVLAACLASPALGQLAQSGHVTVSAGQTAVLACSSASQDETSCAWELPGGQQCDFSQDRKQCRSASNVLFTGTDTLCRINVTRPTEEQNGVWTCKLGQTDGPLVSGEQDEVVLLVAQQAEVEWTDEYLNDGFEVKLKVGEPKTFGCQAVDSRPVGSFVFHLGPDHTVESNRLVPEEDATVTGGGAGRHNVTHSLTFVPGLQMDKEKLYCTFLQADGSGREVFRTQKSLDLAVFALYMEPGQEQVWPAKTGDNLEVSLHFTALPRPKDGDLRWVVMIGEDEHELEVLAQENISRNTRYIAHPLQKVKASLKDNTYNYKAVFTIVNVTSEDFDNRHFFKATNKLSSSNSLDMSYEFDVLVDTAPVVPGSTQYTIIIVVIVIVLLVAIIVAVMLVVYAKKNNLWCFASSTKPYISPDITEKKEPLVEHHPYGRPRPTET